MSFVQLLLDFYNSRHSSNDQIGQVRNKFFAEPNRTNLFNIIFQQNLDNNIRKIAFFTIKNLNIPISKEELIKFHQLLFDSDFQDFASELIVIKTEQKETLETILSNIRASILKEGIHPLFINSYIYFSYYLITKRSILNNLIILDVSQFIINNPMIDIKMKNLALKTIFCQIPHVRNQNEKFINIIELFISIEINDDNFQFFDFILKYLSENLDLLQTCFHQDLSERFFLKISNLLIFIQAKYSIGIEDNIISTILYNIIHICSLNNEKFILPFDLLFDFLVYSEKQLNMVQNDVDSFFSTFIGDCDDNEDYLEYEEEEENEPVPVNKVYTLKEVRNSINYYAFCKYKDLATQYCLSQLNKSIPVNIACFMYFRILDFDSTPVLDLAKVNTFNNKILQFLLLDFCLKSNNSLDSPRYIYLTQNFPAFSQIILNGNDPIYYLILFQIISESPNEIISPTLFVSVLIESLKIFHLFKNAENQIEFLEKIKMYLYYSYNIETNDLKLVQFEEEKCRRFFSESVYTLDDSYINTIKEKSKDLFEGLYSIFKYCYAKPSVLNEFCSILSFLSANKISQIISRKSLTVDVSKYNIFSDDIIVFVTNLIKGMIKNPSLINCCFQLFTTIQFSVNDPRCFELVDSMHHHINCISIGYPYSGNVDVLRIFIKFGKYENLDKICFELCRSNPQYICSFIYEFSFILINQNNIYSKESIMKIIFLLISYIKKPEYIDCIALIFARVALYDRQKILDIQSNLLLNVRNLYWDYSVVKTNNY